MKKIKSIIIVVLLILIILGIIAIIKYNDKNNKRYELEKVDEYNYFKLYQNEKYGVIDKKGNIIVEAIYDIINIPNPSKAIFVCYYEYNETTGEYKTKILNEKNKEILTEFEQVLPLLCEESTSNIPFEKSVLKYRENGKYGLIDFSGKKLTKAIYDDIESLKYKEGTLIVKQNEKLGIINIKGKEIIKAEYDKIESDLYYTTENDYMNAGFIVQSKTEEGYRYGYMDKEGKEILPIEYNEINRIVDVKDSENVYLLISKNGKYGIYKNNKQILLNEYEEIEFNKTNNILIVQKNSKQGVMNLQGKEILPIKFDYILCTGNKITATKGENVEIYNLNGEKQNIEYDNNIETTNENYIITVDDENKYGVKDNNKNVLIENKYEYIEYAFEDYFIVTENGKVGVIEINKGVIIDFKYDIIQKIKDKNVLQAIISNSNTIEMYDNTMEKRLSIKDAILYNYDNYIKLISDKDMQYLDNNGNIISNKELLKENKLFAYAIEGKWGFVDSNDNIIINTEYDMVTEFNEYGFAGIKKGKKWGVVNEEGKIIVEPSYKIEFNEPQFIGKYCKLNFGYGFEYYTDELTK